MEQDWDWRPRQALWRVATLEGRGAGAVFSARLGGCSPAPWDSLNLGLAVGDDPERVAANRRRFAAVAGFDPGAVAAVDQVHGTGVAVVRAPGPAGAADTLLTDCPGVVLTIGAADCAVVYLFDPLRRAIALCHAGWRGTAADAAGLAVAALGEACGTRPADVLAAISPCIGACCYEVDEPVVAALARSAPWAEAVLAPSPLAGRYRLDLAGANRRRLIDRGVPPAAIHSAGLCTACERQRLFSHRRDHGHTGRMQGALWLAPDAGSRGQARSGAELAATLSGGLGRPAR